MLIGLGGRLSLRRSKLRRSFAGFEAVSKSEKGATFG
jgi:hypothetical protein